MIKVMGGEDWMLWMEALQEADVLADGAKTVAYSYIGPELTYPIYYDGSIGQAKQDLYRTADNVFVSNRSTAFFIYLLEISRIFPLYRYCFIKKKADKI